MAERRMFAKTIIDSDAFLDMPMTARLLYYDLGMRADDDGFVNSPKKIMRFIGASDDDLKVLSAKKFIIPFESGVVVIKHWKIHNYIRKDTYNATTYKNEKALLGIDENNAYTTNPVELIPQSTVAEHDPSTTRGRPVDDPSTQVRLGKGRLGKDRIEEHSADALHATRHSRGQHGYVKLNDEEYSRLVQDLGQLELDRVISYVDESAAATGNKNKWKDWNLVLRKASREKWGARGQKNQSQGAIDNEQRYSTDGLRFRTSL